MVVHSDSQKELEPSSLVLRVVVNLLLGFVKAACWPLMTIDFDNNSYRLFFVPSEAWTRLVEICLVIYL